MSAAGTCRLCGCHGPDGEDACKVSGGDTCVWMDKSRTVCTGLACQIKYGAEQRRLATEASRAARKRTPGQVHELILEEKRAKRRAARAKRKQQRGAA